MKLRKSRAHTHRQKHAYRPFNHLAYKIKMHIPLKNCKKHWFHLLFWPRESMLVAVFVVPRPPT
jgi:hypothetical protein